MPETTATSGKGTKFGYATTANGTPTWIGELYVVDHPAFKIESVDGTNYESPDGVTEKVPTGWKEFEPIKGELSYNKTQAAALYTVAGTTLYWTLQVLDGSTWKFKGWISGMSGALPNKDIKKQNIEVQPTGPVVFAAAA